MRKISQPKLVVLVTLMSLISAVAIIFLFAHRGAAQEQEQQRPLRPVQRPVVTNTVQDRQAAQIRELQADVEALKNEISELRQPLNELKACCEKQSNSNSDYEKQIFETKLRLTTLEKAFKGHTHENLKWGVQGNSVQVLDPNKSEKLHFPLSGPVQH